MIQVHANRCSWNAYIKFSPEYTHFLHDINVSEELLAYRFINLETNKIIFNCSLTLDEFRKHEAFDDQTWWTPYNKPFNITDSASSIVHSELGRYIELKSEDMCDLLRVSAARTEEEKRYLNLKAVDQCGQVPLRIFVPSKKYNFTQLCYQVTIPRLAVDGKPNIHGSFVVTNIPSHVEINRADGQVFQPFWQWYFCPMDISSIDLGDTVKYTVTLSDPSSKDPRVLKHSTWPTDNITIDFKIEGSAKDVSFIYLKSKCSGIQDMQIQLTNGVGEFTLPKLQDVRFNLGHKYFTSVLKYDNGRVL